MKRSYGKLYFILIGTIIALSVTTLMIFRFYLYRRLDEGTLYTFSSLMLVVFIASLVLIFLTNLFYYIREGAPRREEHEAEVQNLRAQAVTDCLTGLLNKEASAIEIKKFLSNEGRYAGHTLLLIDLDNFKSINDNFGHLEGDRVIKILAGKIKAVFRTADIVGRFGGDEFIVLMKNTEPGFDIQRKVRELHAEMEYVSSGGGITVTITGSVGISAYKADGKGYETLCKEADEALYRAKLRGKNKFCFFEDETFPKNETSQDDLVLTESSAFIQLNALIDNIDGGIALLEIGTEITSLYLSHSYTRQMDLSYDSIKQAGNRILEFIHKDDVLQVEERLRQGAESEQAVEAVFRRLTENGRTQWYHMRAVHIPFESSNKPVLIAIVTNVSNLKERELNYQAQKIQLETVLRISRVVTFEVDIVKHRLIMTEPTINKYGISTHVIDNMPESMIEIGAIHPDSAEECRRLYHEIYSGIPQGSAVIRTMKTNRQYTIDRFTYFTAFDDMGYAVKAVGIAEEMETRIDTRLHVLLIEKLFRNFSDCLLTIIKVTPFDDRFEFLKPETISVENMRKIHTYTDILEYRMRHMIDPSDRQKLYTLFGIDNIKKQLSEEKIIHFEYRVQGEDGSVNWNAMTTGTYLDQYDGCCYSFIRTRDITFRKNLELTMDDEFVRDPNVLSISRASMKKLADALMKRQDRKSNCAVVMLKCANYDEILRQYGQVMIDHLNVGFYGKVMSIISSNHIPTYIENGTMLILIPEVQSVEGLSQMVEKLFELLRNPAYFQFNEEDLITFRFGIAVEDEATTNFDDLYGKAKVALESVLSKKDKYIAFDREM